MNGRRLVAALVAQMLILPAFAQEPKAPAPVSAEPGLTTAAFGDWTLRCQRLGEAEKAVKICEIALAINGQQQNPIAVIAFGRAVKTEPMRITALIPNNIALPSIAKIALSEKDAKPLELTWKRCAPGGCFADLQLTDAQWKNVHNLTENGSLEFTDSAGRQVKLPISFRGLPQAMDAYGKE